MGVKTIIHINQHKIKANKDGQNRPVITVKTYKSNMYGHNVVIYGQDGLPAATIKYSPEKPLSCGARVWVETNNKVDVV